jgi:hypothetical protein
MTVDYPALLTALYPGAEWSLNGDTYDGLTWLSEGEPPTQAECDEAWPQVQSDLAWKAVRSERDRLLAACDWTQVADAPLTADEKTAWADYRQALRDVPQDFDSPDDVIWPEAP